MATKKARTKTAALTVTVPTSRDDASEHIRRLGDLHRQHLLRKAELDTKIAALQAEYAPVLDGLAQQIGATHQGIQIWAEAHREELTQGGQVKTVKLVTGEVSWRQRPPSIAIKGAEAVISTLKTLGLASAFVRTKEEVNKEALLDHFAVAQADADTSTPPSTTTELIAGISGITYVKGVEDFSVTPFETEAALVQPG